VGVKVGFITPEHVRQPTPQHKDIPRRKVAEIVACHQYPLALLNERNLHFGVLVEVIIKMRQVVYLYPECLPLYGGYFEGDNFHLCGKNAQY
jgi:hypothetical protein